MLSSINRCKNSSRMSQTKTGHEIILERIFGYTVLNNCVVAFDEKTNTIFYSAGCVIVSESCVNNEQIFIQSPSRKTITCLDVIADGKFIVTGECGRQPKVRVWSRSERVQLAELASHHFRISCVKFSPNGRFIVSVGNPEDQTICLWDRALFQKIASAKVTAKVNALSFSENNTFFVTVGVRHVRFWYYDLIKTSKTKETVPLQGRNAVLGDMLHNTFSDVCCVNNTPSSLTKSSSHLENGSSEGQTLILVISQSGQLLQFNETRCMAKWLDLKTQRANCLAISANVVAVGCSVGVCLLFNAVTLEFFARIPLPHKLGVNVMHFTNTGNCDFAAGDVHSPCFPEIIALKIDLLTQSLVCLYADHSMHCWDLGNLNEITLRFSHFYHSRSIWSVAATTTTSSSSNYIDPEQTILMTSHLDSPPIQDHIVTCSDDGTVRLWAFSSDKSTCRSAELFADGKEQLGVIYSDRLFTTLCADDRSTGSTGSALLNYRVSHPISSAPNSPSLRSSHSSSNWENSNNLNCQSLEASHLRTLAISPDNLHLAVGDKAGQLRIYDLATYKLLHKIPAHEAEILCLSYFASKVIPGLSLLCSCSRDRLIHIFVPRQAYSLVQSLADHSGSISAARFVENEDEHQIHLISCGTDRSILCRILSVDPTTQTARFVLQHTIAEPHSHADAAIVGPSLPNLESHLGVNRSASTQLPRPKFYLAVACQDRRMRIYNLVKFTTVSCYRANAREVGDLSCCTVDPTNTFVATAGSYKQVNVFHLFTGEHVATLDGHSELITGLLFLSDLKHLVSVSADSCLFIWKLAPALTEIMLERRRICSALLANTLLNRKELPLSEDAPRASPAGSVGQNCHPINIYPSENSRLQFRNPNRPSSLGLSEAQLKQSFFCLSDKGLPNWAKTSVKSRSQCNIDKAVLKNRNPPRRAVTTYLSSRLDAPQRSTSSRRETTLKAPSIKCEHYTNATTSELDDSEVTGSLDSLYDSPSNNEPFPVNHSTINDSQFNPKVPFCDSGSLSIRSDNESDRRRMLNCQRLTSSVSFAESVFSDTSMKPRDSLVSDEEDNNVMCISETGDSFSRKPIINTSKCSPCSRMLRSWTEGSYSKLSRVDEIVPHQNRTSDHLTTVPPTFEVSTTTVNPLLSINEEKHSFKLVSLDLKPHSVVRSSSITSSDSAQSILANMYSNTPSDDEETSENLEPCEFKGSSRKHQSSNSGCSKVDSCSDSAKNKNQVPFPVALAGIRDALDIAVESFDRLIANSLQQSGHSEEKPNVIECKFSGQKFVHNELDWRFARLRALLGLEVTSVEPPVARTLVADIVERLLPQLRVAMLEPMSDGVDLSRIVTEIVNSKTQL